MRISGGEPADRPGYYKITVRIEGESETWSVLRKPDGTYWQIAAVDYFPRSGGTVRHDVGDQIVDEKTIAQCEAYYAELQQKEMYTRQAREYFIKVGREHGLTNQQQLEYQSDEFFARLFSNSPVEGELTKEETKQKVEEYWDLHYPI